MTDKQKSWREQHAERIEDLCNIDLSGNTNRDPFPYWKSADPVNHPPHYTSHPSGVECIQVTRHMTFNIGNAIKYLWRNGLKDGQPAIQDLEKAIWYIQDEIERVKK